MRELSGVISARMCILVSVKLSCQVCIWGGNKGLNLFNHFSVIESLYLLLTLFSFAFSGDNSGQYRHPHLALAALELWISNQCMPDKCSAQWLDSPNGQGYATDSTKSTAIVWAEMDNNALPWAQPMVPYKWPNSEDGIYPGHKML